MTDSNWIDRLRRTRAVQVLLVYLGAAWVVLQVADIVADALSLPDWVMPVTILLLLVGLVVTLATAWVQAQPATTAAEEAGEVPDDWEIAPGEAFASLKEGRLPHLTWGRSLLAGVAALLLLFGGAGLYVAITGNAPLIGPQEAGASEAAAGIAVVPFEVRGSDAEMWREGMIDLLSTNLDGVGGFRTIDPRTMLARWSEEVGDGAAAADLDQTLRVAGATGARYAILGSLVGTGSDVRLATTVYDLASGERIGQGQAEGAADDILPLTDELARTTLRSLLEATGREGAADPERLTTESLAALRHYLEGERAFRLARFEDAAGSFEEALAEDSTFVAAMARLADTYGWVEFVRAESVIEWGEKALAHVDELPERMALAVRANDALTWGRVDVLPELRDAVRRYPDDPEIWFLLGETLIHSAGPAMAGYDETLDAFERASALDPEFAPYLPHIAELYAAKKDSVRAREVAARYVASSGGDVDDVDGPVEMAIAILGPDSISDSAIETQLESATNRDLSLFLGTFRGWTDHFDRLAVAHREEARRNGLPVGAFELYDYGAQGDFASAEAILDRFPAESSDPAIYLGAVAMLWGANATSLERAGELDGAPCADTSALCRAFLVRALGAEGRSDELAQIVRHAETAAERARSEGDSTSIATWEVVVGQGRLASGDLAAAQGLLGPHRLHPGGSGDVARAGLLEIALEQEDWSTADDLALGVLRSNFRPLGHYALAHAAEARGDAEAARGHWERFVTLTAKGDAERAPRIREGREALARLGG